jgi:transcriptional regulator with XRE-family HTH domain
MNTWSWNPERTRKLIEVRGLRRDFIAKQAGISRQYLNEILIGRRPGPDVISKLADVLTTNSDYLNCESDDPSDARSA